MGVRELRLAVNTKPPIHEFLEKLVGLNHSISSCTPEFSLKINTVGKVFGEQRPSVVRDIPFMAADFAFAKDNVKNSPIWPAIVRKAAEAIARAHTASNTEKLLMGDGEEPFNCAIDVKFAMSLSIYDRLAYKRQYLCKISDLVSRFTGIRLRSTPMLMEDTKEEKTNITKILEDSQHGLTVVFDKWAPTYLVRNNAEDNENRKYKVKEFEAVWLNITKHGNSRDMNFALHNFVASERYKYQDIMDHKGGEERDVHLVYPYQA